jgi:glutathione S-transferase
MTARREGAITVVRLFHRPPSRSSRVAWLLEEIGEPYEVTTLTTQETAADAHRERHPLRRVPVIELDGGYVFESAAICLHLADMHAQAALIGTLGSRDRALTYQWSVFAMTELEKPLVEAASARRAGDEERAEAGATQFGTAAGAVESALEGREYLVGDRFSVADIICGAVLGNAYRLGLLGELPRIRAYVERLRTRPAWERAEPTDQWLRRADASAASSPPRT